MRIVALCQTTGIRPGHAVASAFADRLADVLVMGTLAVLMFSFEKIGLHRKDLLFPVLVLTGAPILLFVGFIRWGDSFAKPMQVLACKLPRAFGARVSNWYAEAVEQTRVFRKAYVLTVAIALTFLAMSLDYASIWLGMCAMGWLMPPTAAVVVGIFIALGTMIPAAPGYIGIYQVACVVALSFYGIGESAALAFSVILQAAILVTIGTQGLIVLMHYGRRLRDLRLRADIHE